MTTRVLVVNIEGDQPVKVTTSKGDGSVIAEKVVPVGGVGWSDYIYDDRRVEVKEAPST